METSSGNEYMLWQTPIFICLSGFTLIGDGFKDLSTSVEDCKELNLNIACELWMQMELRVGELNELLKGCTDSDSVSAHLLSRLLIMSCGNLK